MGVIWTTVMTIFALTLFAVNRRRGGWCYEQNGLFGRALVTLGFDVTRMASAVLRAERGRKADVRAGAQGASSGPHRQ